MNVDMANRLANRRRAAGLSQEALAEKLGVTRQAVSKWERSESSPDTDNLIALANLYGVSLDDLLYAEVQESADTEEALAGSDSPVSTGGEEVEVSIEEDPTSSTDPQEDFHIGPDGIFVRDGKDHVSVSWRDGIHVVDSKKGDTVHVGWSGVHVNDQHYEDLHDFHEQFPQFTHHKERSPLVRSWMRFPFPVLVILVYILAGLATGAWLEGLFLVFAIPIYYTVGAFIGTKSVSALIGGLYAIAATAWFCYMAFVLNQPHPAWIILLTIPLVCALAAWGAHASRKRKRQAEES